MGCVYDCSLCCLIKRRDRQSTSAFRKLFPNPTIHVLIPFNVASTEFLLAPNFVLFWCLIIAVPQISLMPINIWNTLFLKTFPGVAPPAYQPCIIVMSDYCCPTNVVCFSKIFRGLRPPSPKIWIIVMSDYNCCPTNFFNAKCCLNHHVSQKFFGGCAPHPPQTYQPCIIVLSDYCRPTNVICFSKIYRRAAPP